MVVHLHPYRVYLTWHMYQGVTEKVEDSCTDLNLYNSYQNVATVPEDDIHVRSVAIPDAAEQMEINVSAMTRVGRQLAMIGDECNRIYSRKLEDSLFCLAKGLVASVFQTCIWSNFKSVAMKTFGSLFNNGWRKIIDLGCQILWVPLKYVYWRWMPATIFALLMWCLVIYDLRD